MMYHCPECNGTNVLVSMWVEANTEKIVDDAGQEPWCNDCDEHVRRLEVVEEAVDPDRSVTCYFCGDMVDERNCSNADDYNANDGGSICAECIDKRTSAKGGDHEQS